MHTRFAERIDSSVGTIARTFGESFKRKKKHASNSKLRNCLRVYSSYSRYLLPSWELGTIQLKRGSSHATDHREDEEEKNTVLKIDD